MFKKTKKILALVLAVIMACGVLPMAASAADKALDPVIYILGYGGNIFVDRNNPNSEKIYPFNVDIAAVVKEAAAPCLTALATATLTGDYSKYCEEIYSRMAPIYEPMLLNPDGTVKVAEDGKISGNQYRVNYNSHNYFEADEYYFYYDWRLSPMVLKEQIEALVDIAVSRPGSTGKVDIVGRCYGANIISAYLATNEDVSSKVDDIIMYVPSTEGIGLIGKFFTGNIDLNADSINEYVNELIKYENMIEDSYVKNFIDVFLLIMEQAQMLNMGTEMIQNLIDAIKVDLIAPLIRNSYGSFPSFWAMIPEEYYEEALDFVFSTDELREEYAGTLALIKNYHDNVQVGHRANLKAHAEKGVDIHVVSKYNLPSAPVFGNTNPMSDAIAETKLTSFGATTNEYGKTLPASYIEGLQDRKYLSADEKVDASTCLFPETTWFIKNCYHDYFNADALYDFLDTILATENMTVFSNAAYPQYIDAKVTAETLTPVTGKDAPTPEKGSEESMFQMIFKFIRLVIDTFTKLLKGELSFKDLGSVFSK
ncbi:MAG: hypothetical protein IKB12_01885 [Clostridia bacterium]|nr:hypothetical protein [Clostridia bacterium]